MKAATKIEPQYQIAINARHLGVWLGLRGISFSVFEYFIELNQFKRIGLEAGKLIKSPLL